MLWPGKLATESRIVMLFLRKVGEVRRHALSGRARVVVLQSIDKEALLTACDRGVHLDHLREKLQQIIAQLVDLEGRNARPIRQHQSFTSRAVPVTLAEIVLPVHVDSLTLANLFHQAQSQPSAL
jgi:hypothetical protein